MNRSTGKQLCISPYFFNRSTVGFFGITKELLKMSYFVLKDPLGHKLKI